MPIRCVPIGTAPGSTSTMRSPSCTRARTAGTSPRAIGHSTARGCARLAATLLRLARWAVADGGGPTFSRVAGRRHAVVGDGDADHGRGHSLGPDVGPRTVVAGRVEPVALMETVVAATEDEHVVRAGRDVLDRGHAGDDHQRWRR